MEVELRAGAKLNFVTPQELRGALRDWMVELVRGARPKRFSAIGIIAGNAVSIGGQDQQGVTGPEAGFAWAVERVGVVGLTNATDPTSLYVNGTHPDNIVYPSLTGVAGSNGNHEFVQPEILLPNDRLLVASTGAVAAVGQVVMFGRCWEVPVGLLWRLVG